MQPTNVYYGGGVQPQVGNNRSSSRRGLLIVIAAVLLIITIVLGIISSFGGSTPKASGTSKNMIELIGKGDGVKSYELLSTQAKQITPSTQWVTFVVANKAALANNPKTEVVYVSKIDDTTNEEAYNVGEAGSVYRVKIVVDTKLKLINSITINKTIF